MEVHAIDLRPGGLLLYAMIADTPETIELMKRQGMPARHEARITFREIVPLRRRRVVGAGVEPPRQESADDAESATSRRRTKDQCPERKGDANQEARRRCEA